MPINVWPRNHVSLPTAGSAPYPPIDRRAYRASWRNDAAVLVARSLPLSRQNFAIRLSIFIMGLFKKVIIANEVDIYSSAVFNGANRKRSTKRNINLFLTM